MPSTSTEPPTTAPRERPNAVTFGSRALRAAYSNAIVRPLSPFASAKVT